VEPKLIDVIDRVRNENAERRFFWLGADSYDCFGSDMIEAREIWWEEVRFTPPSTPFIDALRK
jgi:hypothetical protein